MRLPRFTEEQEKFFKVYFGWTSAFGLLSAAVYALAFPIEATEDYLLAFVGGIGVLAVVVSISVMVLLTLYYLKLVRFIFHQLWKGRSMRAIVSVGAIVCLSLMTLAFNGGAVGMQSDGEIGPSGDEPMDQRSSADEYPALNLAAAALGAGIIVHTLLGRKKEEDFFGQQCSGEPDPSRRST